MTQAQAELKQGVSVPEVGAGLPIRIRVQHLNQLFQTLDPFPFRERDLDAGVEDYVVGWAGSLGRRSPLAITIHLPIGQGPPEGGAQIEAGFRNFFAARAEIISLDLRALFRSGRDSLAIGLAVLAVTVLVGGAISRNLPEGFAHRFFEEGLIILGWAANWRPIEIFLFDWWPIARGRDLYRRLAEAKVDLVEEPGASGPAGAVV